MHIPSWRCLPKPLNLCEQFCPGIQTAVNIVFDTFVNFVNVLCNGPQSCLGCVKLSHLGVDPHLMVRVYMLDCISNPAGCGLARYVRQFSPILFGNPGSMLPSHDISDIVGRYKVSSAKPAHGTTCGGDSASCTSLSAAMTWLRITCVQQYRGDKVLGAKVKVV